MSDKFNFKNIGKNAANFIAVKGKQNFIIIIALAVLVLIFAALNPNFLSPFNIVSMAQSLAPYAIMGLGVTFVIATGGIDLSIGTTCIAAAVIAGKLYMAGMPLEYTIPVMIAIGALVGFINGLLVAKLKIPAFIATLGTMMFGRGLSAIIVSIPNIFFPNGTWFNKVFSNYNGIPVGLIWVVLFAAICMYLMYKCKIGRYILSIGSNEEATRLSGINTDKYKIIAYTIAGISTGIAAIFWSASFATVATATGNGMELDAIAGVYIGGTSAAGGVASIAGSVIGAIMLVVIRSGLNFVLARFNLNVNSTYVTYVLTGIIVVVAVLMDVIKNKNAGKVKLDSAKKKKRLAKKAGEDQVAN
ncbi:MAG: ABC transporter permease [Clostridia bacterium]|nr:ABC transporter permease [Clostridia bacterium]